MPQEKQVVQQQVAQQQEITANHKGKAKSSGSRKGITIVVVAVIVIIAAFFAFKTLYHPAQYLSSSNGMTSSGIMAADGASGKGWDVNNMIGSSSSSSGTHMESMADDYVDDEMEMSGSTDGEHADMSWISGDQKIVYKAAMTIETVKLNDDYAAVKDLISQCGGFISTSNESTATAKRSPNVTLTVRVPADRFQEFFDQVGGIGTVTSSSMSAENITKVYSDTQSRIASLETQEKRLLELESQASSVEEIMDIEDRLQDVRSELTSSCNSLSTMDSNVAYSTIEIAIRDVSEGGATPTAREGLGERASSAAAQAWEDFVDDSEDFIVGIVADWPGHLIRIIVLAIIIVVIVMIVRRHKAKAPMAPEEYAARLSGNSMSEMHRDGENSGDDEGVDNGIENDSTDIGGN